MFPQLVFFFMFLLIMESIIKSIKEKNKIEEEKRGRSQKLVTKPSKQATIPNKRKEISKIEKSRSLEMQSLEKDFLDDIYNIKDEIKKGDLTNTKNPLKPNKEDILRGIIYSEILSKPKSLRR